MALSLRARVPDENFQHQGSDRLEWSVQSADLNLIDFWDCLGCQVAFIITPSKLLNALKQVFLHVWALILIQCRTT